jgi:hypothetical protein
MDVQAAVADEAASANAMDRLANIFASDVVLACQFNDIRRSKVGDEGILKLWVAVLEDGIRCFLGNPLMPTENGQADPRSRRWRLQQEAREWIFESDDGGPFSFIGLCEALGIDAGYLRERLAKQNGNQITRSKRPPVIRFGGAIR